MKLLDASAITELSLVHLRSMPEEKAAIVLDNRIRTLEEQYKRSYCERGIIAVEIQERELWRWLCTEDGQQFKSFESYVVNAAPQSRSDVFAAMRVVKELREIPREQLEAIPRCNLEVLRTLSTGVRSQPEVLEAAKSLPEKQFVAKVQADHPQQHIEGRKMLKLSFSAGEYDEVCKALDSIGEKLELEDRAAQLLAWAIDYNVEHEPVTA